MSKSRKMQGSTDDKHIEQQMKGVSRSRRFEIGILTALILIALGSLLADIHVLPVADLLRTIHLDILLIDPSSGIYQTMADILSSVAALGLAIISLITVVSDKRVFGISLSKYLMVYRHTKPFQHRVVIVAVIVLTALVWLLVAIAWYNLSVGLFLIATVLVCRLTKDAVQSLHSSDDVKQEIKAFIVSTNNLKFYEALFDEIKESIVSGDTVTFEGSLALAIEILHIELIPETPQDRVQRIQENIQGVINVAVSHNNSSFAFGVFNLYISAYRAANRNEKAIVPLKLLDNYEIYHLLRTCDNPNAWSSGVTLHEWQRQMFANNSTKVTELTDGFTNLGQGSSIAAHLYHVLCTNKNEFDRHKQCFDILQTAQKIYEFATDTQKIYAEINYLNIVKALFDAREERLLNIVFGVKESLREINWSFRGVLANPYEIHLTNINMFICLSL